MSHDLEVKVEVLDTRSERKQRRSQVRRNQCFENDSKPIHSKSIY